MILKPQDVVISLKLAGWGNASWTYQQLAEELGISPSAAHGGVKRALAAGLLVGAKGSEARPNLLALEEFLVHGIRYAFPAIRGSLTRGVPTGYAAPPLNQKIIQSDEPPPVWPYAEGKARGYGLSPLYPSVPDAAKRDPALYELLALVDAIRDGRARERNLAVQEIKSRLAARR